MHLIVAIFQGLSIVGFLGYGWVCVFTDAMVSEFERYGMPAMRRLVGALEMLGALGLLVGLAYPPLAVAAATGLALLMVVALAVRVRIRDPWLASVPAATLLVMNVVIAVHRFGELSGA